MEVFAFLDMPVKGIADDEAIVTDCLMIPVNTPLDRLAAAIDADGRGDDDLLEILGQELLRGGFPKPCNHLPEEQCNALGTAEDLKLALERVLRRIARR